MAEVFPDCPDTSDSMAFEPELIQRLVIEKAQIAARYGVAAGLIAGRTEIQIQRMVESVTGAFVQFLVEVLRGPPLEISRIRKVLDKVYWPTNWWYALLDRFIPDRLERLRAKIRYEARDVVVEEVLTSYNVCPHIDMHHARHMGWLSLSVRESRQAAPLLHALRGSPRAYADYAEELDSLHRAVYDYVIPGTVAWEAVLNAVADLIEASLRWRPSNDP